MYQVGFCVHRSLKIFSSLLQNDRLMTQSKTSLGLSNPSQSLQASLSLWTNKNGENVKHLCTFFNQSTFQQFNTLIPISFSGHFCGRMSTYSANCPVICNLQHAWEPWMWRKWLRPCECMCARKKSNQLCRQDSWTEAWKSVGIYSARCCWSYFVFFSLSLSPYSFSGNS